MTNKTLSLLRADMKRRQLDALAVTFMPHVQYLTGFSGSNGLCIITQKDQALITDGRYTTQVKAEVKNFKIYITKGKLFEEAAGRKLFHRLKTLAVQADRMTITEYAAVKAQLPKLKLMETTGMVETLASVKQSWELVRIKEAIRMADTVFLKLIETIQPGMTEREIAAIITFLLRREGADSDAFEPIVASGLNGALPHARPTDKKLRKGELVTLDFGARHLGYISDLTRTIALGKITSTQKRIYSIVKDAQEAAIEAARAGMTTRSLDAVARKVIEQAGFGKYFSHSLGHGIGRQVHEAPLVSYRSDEMLREGNVITIEPGIYLPGVGGVRIEDDILLTHDGCRVLTTSPKELITL